MIAIIFTSYVFSCGRVRRLHVFNRTYVVFFFVGHIHRLYQIQLLFIIDLIASMLIEFHVDFYLVDRGDRWLPLLCYKDDAAIVIG